MDNSENRRVLTTQQLKAMEAEKEAQKKQKGTSKGTAKESKQESKNSASKVQRSTAEGSGSSDNSKKPKRRMKKQVRYTLAGLFLASAVVVCALPVSEAQASSLRVDDPSFPDSRTAVVNYNYQTGITPSGDDLDLDPTRILDRDSVPSTDKRKSYCVRQLSDGQWSYNWQFGYYVATIAGGNQRGIICEYNNLYPENIVTLSNTATVGYVTVEPSVFQGFMDTTGATAITASYDIDYVSYKTASNPTENMKYHKKYNDVNSEYTNWENACERYYQYINVDKPAFDIQHAKWVTDKEDYEAWVAAGRPDPALEDPGEEPTITVVLKPDDISKAPRDLSNGNNYRYYCEYNNAKISSTDPNYIPATNCTLTAVIDNVNGPNPDGTAKSVFIVSKDESGEPISPAFFDNCGFLVKDQSVELIGISKDAFAAITNVQELTLPDEIKYIGDGAFAGSFIQTITLQNVENIGNFAFRECPQLNSVVFKGTKKIGAECFEGCPKITSITFPYSVDEVGYGAFARCNSLRDVDLSEINTACVLHDYVFYDDVALSNVNMQSSAISNIGEGVFSVTSAPTGSLTDVKLPNQITGAGTSVIGDLLFAGRTNLQTVTFPQNFGNNADAEIPSSIFKNCANLSYVDFNMGQGSIINGYATFKGNPSSGFTYNDLFRDVTNPDFYIKGPEKNNAGVKAYPRQSTWQAFTSVSNYVPYVYVNSAGVECYEVSDGDYLLQANERGELTSCELVNPSATTPIDLVIPKRVGDYDVKTIADGCFNEEALRNRIKSITVEDDSLTGINANVFKDLPNVTSVTIGNSVSAIGDSAFADCPNLVDVYFNTPSVGYEAFTIGNDAFKTGSSELTFHGDIVPGYAPFEFATGADSGKIDTSGKRICYKSNSPTFLTCMYDNKTGEVVLLDYPKYNDLDDLNAEHCRDMEKMYYENTRSSTSYENDRNEFYTKWANKVTGTGISDADKDELYQDSYYGPFLSDDAFRNFIINNYPYDSAGHPENDKFYTAGGDVNPALFPDGYFTQYPYSIIENYENPRGTNDWNINTDEELLWIKSCINIVVPDGITSIDAYGFFDANENLRNTATYFQNKAGTPAYKAYEMAYACKGTPDPRDPSIDVVPGLFSGLYQDYDNGTPEASQYETAVRGNDRIESVSMSSVKSMPDYCFDSCEKLKDVVLGEDLSEMGMAPFRSCYLMDNIVGNDYFEAENRMIYTVNPDDSYTIKECLPSRGSTGDTSIDSATDPKIANVSAIEPGAFEDCDSVVRVDMSDAKQLKIVPEDCFRNCDMLQLVYLPDSVDRIEENAFKDDTPITVQIPAIEVDIVTSAFDHDSRNTIRTYEDSAAWDYGKYYNLTVERIANTFTVEFHDYDGKLLKRYEYVVENSKVDEPDPLPTRTGYEFKGWSDPGWEKVVKDVYTIAQYDPVGKHKVTFYKKDGTTVWNTQYIEDGGAATAPLPPDEAGYTFVGWMPKTFMSNVKTDLEVVATYDSGGHTPVPAPTTSPKPTSSSSASPSPTATPTPGPSAKLYTCTVSGGSGTGSYYAGQVVPINAYDMGAGQVFDRWTTSTAGVAFGNATNATTYFTMPANNVAITATFKAGGNSGGSSGGSGGGSGKSGGSGGNGGNSGQGTSKNDSGTSVEVSKSGISNTGVAGATVSGATDNFVVKVTDDQTAADLALTALQNKYGDITSIKYLPMDISLYDSTGRTKITDTSGIKVNLTLPLPDGLASYAGNNKVASVTGGVVEDLNSRFTTVDGVPCISFTATHFSPYMIYVDTANLTESTIDYTPKTGDPIHPKWFLAIGLACVSAVLFFMKDKKKVKATNA